MENTVSLVGQPNVGKTTLFNLLTGMRQKIGNWAGVTVEKKEGILKDGSNKEYAVVDLPGIYSLMSDSIDQKIARDYILKYSDIVVNVVDTPNINRNLYLTLQLLELGKFPILCLNLIDEAEKHGLQLDIKKLSEKLGNLPIITSSGRFGIGVEELKNAIYSYEYKEPPIIKYSDILEDGINKVVEKINEYYPNNAIPDKFKTVPKRWIALSLFERDPDVLESFNNPKLMDFVQQITEKIESEIKHDIESYIVEQRYKKSDKILKDVIKEQNQVYDDIDPIVLHPIYGLCIFGIVMYLMYSFVFGVGNIFSGYVAMIFEYVGNYLTYALPPQYVGVVVDGALAGVGGVLEFFPMIVLIMLSLSLLEDTGYLSRVAALMHKYMSKMGLGGKSIIPFIVSFGCTVPGLMASRFMSNHKERLITLLMAPMMPCSARFIIIGFMAAAFFPENTVLFTIAIISIMFGVIWTVSYILSKLIKGKSEEFIFELPPYRTPDWNNILKSTWDKSKSFLKKAGTVIVAGSVAFYWLLNYPTVDNSYAIAIGRTLEPITLLMGIDWRGALALLFGIVAKELVVSTMDIVYGGNYANILTPLNAFVLCIVSVLYVPCVATIAAFYVETKSIKWTTFSILFQTFVATIVGIIIYNAGTMMGF
ncbi:ferrous iron transport protein B [Methanococcus aeolicus Nankai-3]|uniref:Ferrous iron transport protein B n=1 Tax=Methanococcus aeolicus (strain ATCC BAA-1280 / DSM 17508 / OCM 812 / Nankai-3) TaxID=419665 RepID=A6UUZ6_META3|nr:ferrous iron transport protein B [Methanococcus aeolicus]ABR56318.1 ferrous iron transport protein B [Methanococcus aeolicus Nankai-3]